MNTECTIHAPLAEIADGMADALLYDVGYVDVVEVDGIVYEFEVDFDHEEKVSYTGVEFMGARESYIDDIYTINSIKFLGAKDASGKDVTDKVEINLADIDFSYYDDIKLSPYFKAS